jgi:hypothetical protein
VYVRLVNPHHPMPEIPESISELRMRVVPRDDDGADVFIDGDTKDEASASAAARDVKNIIDSRKDNVIIAAVTGGLLDGVHVAAEGTQVKLTLTASRRQIEMLLRLVAATLGVTPTRPAASGAPGTAPTAPH